jgi:hypothetical protein
VSARGAEGRLDGDSRHARNKTRPRSPRPRSPNARNKTRPRSPTTPKSDNIARWDGSAWEALIGPSATGVNSQVHALSVYNGELIAGGWFFQAGGVTVNLIARWNGTAWAALSGPSGTGVNDTVAALSPYNGELIAGGGFTIAGGIPSFRIGRYISPPVVFRDGFEQP